MIIPKRFPDGYIKYSCKNDNFINPKYKECLLKYKKCSQQTANDIKLLMELENLNSICANVWNEKL